MYHNLQKLDDLYRTIIQNFVKQICREIERNWKWKKKNTLRRAQGKLLYVLQHADMMFKHFN